MSKINSLLKKTELFEKLALYGDRKSFLESIAQLSDGGASPHLVKMDANAEPEQDMIGPPRPPVNTSIPASVQQKLNELLVPAGKIVPIKVDGVLGHETKKALDAFRKFYNVSPAVTDQQLFSKIMSATAKAGPQALPPDHPLFQQLQQEGPVDKRSPLTTSRYSSTIDKANLFNKLSQKYEK